MPTQEIIKEHNAAMEKVFTFLLSEFKTVRTGRASTGLVEHLKINYYGSFTPLNQLATIATPDAATIVIKPFDMSALKEIEKAIRNSDLSIAPVSDGKLIRLSIPPLSQERRNQLITQTKQMGEQAKISLRQIRRDANKKLEDEQKSKRITEDDRDKGKKDIDELTKDYTEKIDNAVKTKSNEIMKQ